jgi:hypothetical protein
MKPIAIKNWFDEITSSHEQLHTNLCTANIFNSQNINSQHGLSRWTDAHEKKLDKLRRCQYLEFALGISRFPLAKSEAKLVPG